jgi:flagellar hook-associated protein 2
MTSTVSSLSSAAISSALTADKARLQKPITQLTTQETADKADISAWGSIQGSVSSLSSVLSGIADIASTNTLKASSTAASIATATAASSAVAGTYSLSSATLAKTQEIYSAVQSSAAKNIGAGSAGKLTFTLTSGKTETVTVQPANQTLTGIAAAINAVDGGVQASVIGTSTGARLVLQSSAPGSANGFGFSGSGGLAALKYSSASAGGSFTRAQTAADAGVKINGVPITSTSNTISSAVKGLTIKLIGSGTAAITVASSAGSISGAVSAVATNLNAAIATIASETKYVAPKSSASASASSAKSGPLLGNFTASNLSTQLLAAVSGAAASGLSATGIGLTVGSTGKVTFSSATFDTAYAANPTGVAALLTKIHSSLSTLTIGALGSGSASGGTNKGSIAAQTAAQQNAITTLQSEALQIAKENNAQLQILVKEYTTAETASTNAQITQTYLSIFTGTSNNSSG